MSGTIPPTSPAEFGHAEVAADLEQRWEDLATLTLKLKYVKTMHYDKPFKRETVPLPDDPTPWKVRIRKLCREFRQVFGRFEASREFTDIFKNFTSDESDYLVWALNYEWLKWNDKLNKAGPNKLNEYDDECCELLLILYDITELLDHPTPSERVSTEEEARGVWLKVMLDLPRPPNRLLREAAARIKEELKQVKNDVRLLELRAENLK